MEKSRYLFSSIVNTDDVLPKDINRNQALIIIYNPMIEEYLEKSFLITIEPKYISNKIINQATNEVYAKISTVE
tara:strand:+ start:292 stop:513 length:222 start_codon:yes stop_codon:yes gene_type:complete